MEWRHRHRLGGTRRNRADGGPIGFAGEAGGRCPPAAPHERPQHARRTERAGRGVRIRETRHLSLFRPGNHDHPMTPKEDTASRVSRERRSRESRSPETTTTRIQSMRDREREQATIRSHRAERHRAERRQLEAQVLFAYKHTLVLNIFSIIRRYDQSGLIVQAGFFSSFYEIRV